MENKVFLGGTCADSTWRNDLIKLINVNYFNPVVKNWTPECQQNEIAQKEIYCNIHLYCLTSSKSIFSIAEVVDSVHNKDKITILHIIPDNFSKIELKHTKAIVNLVKQRGGITYIGSDLTYIAKLLNNIK